MDGSSLSDAGPAAAPRLPGGMSAGPWLVLAASVLWGTTGTSQALAPAAASSLAIGSLRLTLGAAVLLAFAAARGAVTRELIARAPGPLLGVAAGIAIYQLAFFSGVRLTGVAVGTLVGIGSSPIFAGLLGMAVRGERPGRRWVAATALAVAGTTLLVGSGGSDVDPLGIGLALGAGGAYALYVLASKIALDRGWASDALTVRVFALAGALLVPVALVAGVGPLGSVRGVLVVLHLGVVTVAVAYVLFGRGLAGVGVGAAGTLTLAEPATAALLGVAVVGERLSGSTVAGVALIAAGLLLLVARHAPEQVPSGDGRHAA